MDIKKFRMRPPGNNDYDSILHPETSAECVLTEEGKNLQEKVNEFNTHKADIVSQEVGKGADIIGLPDPNNLFTSTNVGGAMQELFTNVSNGKQLVGGAITDIDDSIVVPTDPTFQELADLIRTIETGIDTSDATATADDILNGKTAYVKGGKITGNILIRTGAVTAQSRSRSGTTLRFRPQPGYYDGASNNYVQYSDSNFVASNIKKGVSIFGLTGILETGKRFATGNTTIGNMGLFEITGLAFRPSYIIAYNNTTNKIADQIVMTLFSDNIINNSYYGMYGRYASNGTTILYSTHTTNYIKDDGVRYFFPSSAQNTPISWIAFE